MTYPEFVAFVENHKMVLVFYSNNKCGICQALKPKMFEAKNTTLNEVIWLTVDTESEPEVSGQNRILTVPAIQFYMDGKELFRRAGSFGVSEVTNQLAEIINRNKNQL